MTAAPGAVAEPPLVIVDVNEPLDVAAHLEAAGVAVERRRLAPADYVLGVGDEGPLAVERKTIGDFHQSLLQKRLFEQLSRLRDAYPSPVMLLLEGDLSMVEELKQPRAVWGALASIATSRGVTIVPSPSHRGTAEILARMAFRLHAPGRGVDVRFKPRLLSTEDQQRFAVQGLPGVGDVGSRNLLERFGSVRGVFDATEKDLKRTAGIGDKRARDIARFLAAPYESGQSRLAQGADDVGESDGAEDADG